MDMIVHYGKRRISFQLQRKNVKHINLTVHPDQTISVSANDDVTVEEVKEFVESKGRWIVSKLNYFERTSPFKKLPPEYVTGETFRYLGRQYRLNVIDAEEEFIRFFRGTIEMYVKDKTDFESKKRLMNRWYDERREVVFREALERMYQLMKVYDIDYPALEVRQMKRRWGSYLPRTHKIVLNKDLIIAPRFCIDYVVLHELLHAKFPDHDYHFFRHLQMLMPNWQERKRILDEEVAREVGEGER